MYHGCGALHATSASSAADCRLYGVGNPAVGKAAMEALSARIFISALPARDYSKRKIVLVTTSASL